jgi:hypothetical protein
VTDGRSSDIAPALPRRRLLTAALWLLAGCRRRLTPEQQIRKELHELEIAIEQKDISRIREGLSATFRGPEELDRQGVMALLHLRLRNRPDPHLLVRLEKQEMIEAGVGRVELVVAMAALPIAGPQSLPRLEADFYRFQLELAQEDGRFRVRHAKWERASLEDFL